MGEETFCMKPASRQQAVFTEALRCPGLGARAAYLDGACGSDGALRPRIALMGIKLGMSHPNRAKVLDAGATFA